MKHPENTSVETDSNFLLTNGSAELKVHNTEFALQLISFTTRIMSGLSSRLYVSK